MRRFNTKFVTKRTFALGLSVVLAATSVMGCSKAEDDDDDDDERKPKSKVEDTVDGNLTTESVDLSFVDTIKEAEKIKSGEATGSISVNTVTSGVYEYDYKVLSDGNTGAQIIVTDKNDTSSKLLDLIVYDYKIYADFYNLLSKYGGEEIAASFPQGYISIDLDKILQQSGMNIRDMVNSADKQKAVTVSNDVLDILVKDFPSVFGEELVVNADNAEAVTDDFLAFVVNGDLTKIIGMYKELFASISPEVSSAFEQMESQLNFDGKSVEDVSEDDKQEIANAIKMVDVKMTDNITGEEGSRVFDFSCDFKFNNAESQLNGLSFSFSSKLEEKSVDIASIVPTGASDFTDMLLSTFQTQSSDLTDDFNFDTDTEYDDYNFDTDTESDDYNFDTDTESDDF